MDLVNEKTFKLCLILLATILSGAAMYESYIKIKDERKTRNLAYRMNQFMFDKMVAQDLESRIENS